MPVVNVYSEKQFYFSKSTISKILFLRSKTRSKQSSSERKMESDILKSGQKTSQE
jgi:hypothetical protein